MDRNRIKIAIADDNPRIRQTLFDILTEKGYSAKTVKNGYELLSHIKKEYPNIVILDLVMPEKDGAAIFTTIKSISPGTKIIIYTGYHKYENSAFAKTADRFMLKDDNPEGLLRAVEELAEIE